MAKIYDFIKYKSEQEIAMYESEVEDVMLCFGCPDCGSINFILMLDMTAECSDCDFTVSIGEALE